MAASASQAQLAEKGKRIAQLEKLLAESKLEADKVIVLERAVTSLKFRLEEQEKKLEQAEAAAAALATEESESSAATAVKVKPWTPPKPSSPTTRKPLASEISVRVFFFSFLQLHFLPS